MFVGVYDDACDHTAVLDPPGIVSYFIRDSMKHLFLWAVCYPDLDHVKEIANYVDSGVVEYLTEIGRFRSTRIAPRKSRPPECGLADCPAAFHLYIGNSSRQQLTFDECHKIFNRPELRFRSGISIDNNLCVLLF